MAGRFKLIPLDFVTFVLTILAFAAHNVGIFIGAWWTNDNLVGTSHFGMISFRICVVSCIDRSILDIDGDREWIFAVRVFEVFGEILLILAFILAILLLILRRRLINTSLIYIHGTAALFILVGVFMFLGFHGTLNKDLEGTHSLKYPFGVCLAGGILCVIASIIYAVALKKHLSNQILDDDDDDGDFLEPGYYAGKDEETNQ